MMSKTPHRWNKFAIAVAIAPFAVLPAWGITEGESVSPTDWTWPPLIVIPLLLVACVYAIGIVRMFKRAAGPKRHWRSILYFALGWISLLIALDSPIHELGEQLFWVHMTQHEILMLISAPLLVLSRPLVPFLWALSRSSRNKAASWGRSRIFRGTWKSISTPLSAWLLSALALWVWHAPSLFDRTLHSDWIHAAQHLSFFLTALLFWWPVAQQPPALGYGGALAYVFTTALHTSVLGGLLTFAPRAWYSSYVATAPAWHLTALEDQQLGGLIMWIPAGTLLLAVSLVLLVKWMQESQHRWQYTRMAELSRVSKGAIE
jgi:putative membrane protein